MENLKNEKKYITFTNIIFILATIVYILNLFVIKPDTGSMALQITENLKEIGFKISNPIIFKIFGLWGGHVNDFLGFNINKICMGEVWRIYTVVLTHGHLPHFVMNMAALIISGNHIEKKYGVSKTIILFIILTALNGFATDLIYFKLLGNEVVTSTGASGWITCLFGIILVKCLKDKNYFKNEFTKGERIYMIIYFVSTTFVLLPNLFTITAHISGLIIGCITELIIEKIISKKSDVKVKE